MTIERGHDIGGGRIWRTMSDGPYVMVPVEQIEGMSAEEIGRAVLGLVEKAHVTAQLEWLDFAHMRLHEAAYANDETKRNIRLCQWLSWTPTYDEGGEVLHDEIGYFTSNFRTLESMRHLDEELEEGYEQICVVLDGAYKYLQTKKRPLTPLQREARKVILELRHGCSLCGLLDSQHADTCLQLRTTQA
jgi:hypothetical protein